METNTKAIDQQETKEYEQPIETKIKNLSWLHKIQTKIGSFLLDEASIKEFEDN
jgi:hypothetical protein